MEFIQKLKIGQGQGIEIRWTNGNEEAGNFAKQIGYIFQRSGWIVDLSSTVLIGGAFEPGIKISAKNEEALEKANYIMSVLDFIKFNESTIEENLLKQLNKELLITIGYKSIR